MSIWAMATASCGRNATPRSIKSRSGNDESISAFACAKDAPSAHRHDRQSRCRRARTLAASSCPELMLTIGDGYRWLSRNDGGAEFGECPIACGCKRGHLRGRNGFARRHRFVRRLRVDEDAVFLEPVVEMRTGCQTGR